jgi:hypothetical protein
MSEAKPLPPVEVLREHFHYDPDTGVVRRLKKSARRHVVGEEVGSAQSCRGYRTYLTTQFQYQVVKLHRLAWKLHTGEEPPRKIDHANGDYSDNRWVNLRPCTPRLNAANWERPSQHLRGTYLRSNGRWQASGSEEGRRVHLGTFGTMEEAHQAHVQWSLKTFGEFSIYARAVGC